MHNLIGAVVGLSIALTGTAMATTVNHEEKTLPSVTNEPDKPDVADLGIVEFKGNKKIELTKDMKLELDFVPFRDGSLFGGGKFYQTISLMDEGDSGYESLHAEITGEKMKNYVVRVEYFPTQIAKKKAKKTLHSESFMNQQDETKLTIDEDEKDLKNDGTGKAIEMGRIRLVITNFDETDTITIKSVSLSVDAEKVSADDTIAAPIPLSGLLLGSGLLFLAGARRIRVS